MSLLDEVLEAHGGAARWRGAGTIRARVRSGGLLLATRAPGRLFSEYELTVRVREPWAMLEPAAGAERGVFDHGRVRLWNYMTMPLLLTREEVEVSEGEPLDAGSERWHRLDARFGHGIETHSARQSFHFDERRLLRRHDYTAEVIGGWARAARLCDEHREFDGLVFPTRRRVHPILPGGRVGSRPTLVSIDLARIEVEGSVSSVAKPVLWQIKVSHYSEKVRWALDYKGVEHERKSPPPGGHMLIALAKTRGKGKTFPLLELEGRTYGDSTEIVEALEERFPEPPLYPGDPEARRRALEIEDWFDEEIGPHPRLLGWHEILRDREATDELLGSGLAGPIRRGGPVLRGAMGTFLQLRYGVKSEEAAEEARARIRAALDRIESELDGREYLVGETFSVADLTAAALLYPTVLPAEGPTLPGPPPPGLAAFRDSLADRPGFRWVEEMFSRHRSRGAGEAATPA